MAGKTVLITGANSGIGFATASELAKRGDEIVMVCRDADRAASALGHIHDVANGPSPSVLLADLSSQDEIHTLVAQIRERFDHIDVLVNNAGACFAHRELTIDGVEKTFATNHLAPFLLTTLLLDKLEQSSHGRIVTVTSEIYAHKLDFDNLQGELSYGFMSAYKRSKLANILFTFELARRLEGTNVTANCVSPGAAKTRFGDNMTGLVGLAPRIMKRLPIFKKPAKAARTVIELAAAPELEGVSGHFLFRGKDKPTKKLTHDLDIAAELWDVSECLTAHSYLPD